MARPEKARGSPIIFVNADESVALIDIPTAIACAQVPNGQLNDKALYSTVPREEPYPPNEPKTEQARQNLFALNCDATGLEEFYRNYIRHALDETRQQWRGWWCLSRKIVPYHDPDAPFKRPKKKLIEAVQALALESRENSLEPEDVQMKMEEKLKSKHDPRKNDPLYGLFTGMTLQNYDFRHDFKRQMRLLEAGIPYRFTYSAKPASGVPLENDFPMHSNQEPWESNFSNPTNTPLRLTITETGLSTGPRSFTFTIPPNSTCVVAKIENSTTFRSLVRSAFQPVPGMNATRVFDFICLDPPWPNSSVARKRNYNNARYLAEVIGALKGMDLDQYVLPGGYVGVWITNKPAMRKTVLEPGGLFDIWNVQLVEEWIYTKTTAHGEPVVTLEGLWRKPYEVFLLGRAPENSLCKVQPVYESTWNGVAMVKRRVIIAVPDFHSRKPCLKSLVERWLGFEDGKYEALEVFARYAIAGWWCWGDECLRFNWEGYWTDSEPDAEPEIGGWP